jgi:hypothetical protein
MNIAVECAKKAPRVFKEFTQTISIEQLNKVIASDNKMQIGYLLEYLYSRHIGILYHEKELLIVRYNINHRSTLENIAYVDCMNSAILNAFEYLENPF